MNRRSQPLWLAACMLFGSGTSTAATYQLTLLPTLGGTTGSARAINNAGAVVGASSTAGNLATHATFWQHGLATELGTLGMPTATSGASGINASGQIAGYSQIGAGGTNSVIHAVRWAGPAEYPKADLGAVDGLSAASSSAFGINNAGQVVGYGGSADYFRAGHLWKAPDDLKSIDSGYAAYGINNNQQIVGDTGSSSTALPGLWTLNANGSFTETALGLLAGASRGYASGINDGGLIIGTHFFSSGSYRAVRWQAGTTLATDLGTLGGSSSSASGLNEAGCIVGAAWVAGNAATHAVLWQPTGAAIDLNSLIDPVAADGWVLTFANDINDNGAIVGSATKNGETRAFLLSLTGVPEPVFRRRSASDSRRRPNTEPGVEAVVEVVNCR